MVCSMSSHVLQEHVMLCTSQDEAVKKYDLSSVTLEKFFVGPLPEHLTTDPSNFTQPTTRPSPVNGCLSATDLLPTVRSGVVVDDRCVIDLTDDDFEIPAVNVQTSSAAVVKKHAGTTCKNHRIKSGLLIRLSLHWLLACLLCCV